MKSTELSILIYNYFLNGWNTLTQILTQLRLKIEEAGEKEIREKPSIHGKKKPDRIR